MVTPCLFATLRCQNNISKTVPVNVLNLPRLRKEHIIQPCVTCVRDYYCQFELLFASLASTWDVHQGFALPFKVQRSDGAELQNLQTSHVQRSKVHEAITIVVDRANFASRLRLPQCGHSKSAHANTNSRETAHENDWLHWKQCSNQTKSLARSFHTHESEKQRSKCTFKERRA